MVKSFRIFNVPVSLLLSSIFAFIALALLSPGSASASPYSEAVEADAPLAYWSQYNSTLETIPDETGNGYTITTGSGSIGSDVSEGPVSLTGDPSLAFSGNTSDNGVITPLSKEDLTNYSEG